MTILGHTVGERSIRPMQHRLDALRNYEVPHDKASLLRFLALMRYYFTLIPLASQLAAPLTPLTNPYARFEWNDERQRAFDAIKEALLNCAALSEPLNDRPFYLMTDASNQASGYLLEQRDDNGAPRIIVLGGCAHKKSEKNYQVFELELLALRRALQATQPLLDANPHRTIWCTDNQTAQSFKRCSTEGKSPAMIDFIGIMQHVDLDIQLISGKDNSVADAVSRFNHYHKSPPIGINMFEPSDAPFTPPPSSPMAMSAATPPFVPLRAIPAVSLDVPRGTPAISVDAKVSVSTSYR